MKKLLLIIVLGLSFCSLVSAKEFVCFQEKKKENTILINVKPMFGLKDSYSNIEIENIPKRYEKIGDFPDNSFRWAEVFFDPEKKIYNILFFAFYEEGYVTKSNPLKPQELMTDYKPDRLVLYMNKRDTPLWDIDMFDNPDKKIIFEACIKK